MNDNLTISVLDRYCVRDTMTNSILYQGTYRACKAFKDSLSLGHSIEDSTKVAEIINRETKEINTL